LLDSLFHSTTTIEINEANVLSLFFLAEILDNPFLLSKCEKYSTTNPQTFSFCFKQLRFLHQKDRNSLNNLQISVNEMIFQTNRLFYSCLSDSFLKLIPSPSDIILSIPQQHLFCFISFLNILKGIPMNLSKLDHNSIISVIQIVDCSSAFSFLSSQIKIPESFSESIQFLQNSFCSYLKEHFVQSISILSSNLREVSFDILNLFSIETLEMIFSSEELRIPNEDFLFQLISRLIQINSNRKYLYRFIFLPKVSPELIQREFSNLRIEDINSELLGIFKTKLFCKANSDEIKSAPNRYEDSKFSSFPNSTKIELNHHEGIVNYLRKQSSNSVFKATESMA
jgi:hypothetical protein